MTSEPLQKRARSDFSPDIYQAAIQCSSDDSDNDSTGDDTDSDYSCQT